MQKKITTLSITDEKKQKKNKYLNTNQASFHFEDYLEINDKNKKTKNSNISQDRIYLLFFYFFL